MHRSVAAFLAILILPSLAPAQQLTTGQQGTHEVVKGETLWALAERYLGDPFRWPLIYEANRDRIEDPHWIYPHQMLNIPGLEAGPAQVQDVTVVAPGGEPQAIQAAAPGDLPPCPAPDGRTVFYEGGRDDSCAMPAPATGGRTAFYVDPNAVTSAVTASGSYDTYAVPRGAVYSAPWLEAWEADLPFIGTVKALAEVDAEVTRRGVASSYETLQVDLEDGVSLQVGDLLQSFVVGRKAEGFGQVVRPTGILAVTSVEEAGVEAMVSAEFARVALGQKVRMAPAYAVPANVEAEDVESNLTANILGFDETLVIQGIGAVAFLNVGEAQGVGIGDEFLAYVNRGDGWEGEPAAWLQVVLLNGNVASARVRAIQEPALKTGTQVHLVKKMR